jgi:hypothetical protein
MEQTNKAAKQGGYKPAIFPSHRFELKTFPYKQVIVALKLGNRRVGFYTRQLYINFCRQVNRCKSHTYTLHAVQCFSTSHTLLIKTN